MLNTNEDGENNHKETVLKLLILAVATLFATSIPVVSAMAQDGSTPDTNPQWIIGDIASEVEGAAPTESAAPPTQPEDSLTDSTPKPIEKAGLLASTIPTAQKHDAPDFKTEDTETLQQAEQISAPFDPTLIPPPEVSPRTIQPLPFAGHAHVFKHSRHNAVAPFLMFLFLFYLYRRFKNRDKTRPSAWSQIMNNQDKKNTSPLYQTASLIRKTALIAYVSWLFLGLCSLPEFDFSNDSTSVAIWYCMIAGVFFSLMVLLSIFNNGEKVLWKLSVVLGVALVFCSTLILGNLTYQFNVSGIIYSALSIGAYWLLYWTFYSKIVLIQKNHPVTLNAWKLPRFIQHMKDVEPFVVDKDEQQKQ